MHAFRGLGRLLLVLAAWGLWVGCSKTDVRNEVAGSANGEEIRVYEVREFLGLRGGSTPASDVPVEKKKEALNRLIGGRLLAQEARSKGMDNTEQFRDLLRQNEADMWITALFQKELEARVGDIDKDVKAEAKRMMDADKNLKEADAEQRARKMAYDGKVRKMQEEVLAAARKEIPSTVDKATLERIGKKEKVGDDAVLATAGTEKVTYGEVKGMLNNVGGGPHAGESLYQNTVAIERMLDRELMKRSLLGYAKKQGIEGSKWLSDVRKETERVILINMLAEREILKNIVVSDKEIEAAYKENQSMLVQNGKQIPLAQVKEQLRQFVGNNRKRKAIEDYVEELRKKAKITVNDAVLAKV